MNYLNISVCNNQAFSQSILNAPPTIIGLLTEWSVSAPLKLRIFNEIVNYVAYYGNNRAFPSQGSIARRLKCSRKWVNIVVGILDRLGLINKTAVIVDGRQKSSMYSLADSMLDRSLTWALKDLVPAFKKLACLTKKRTEGKLPPLKDSYREFSPNNIYYFKKELKILYVFIKSISFTLKPKKISPRYDKPLPFESGIGKTSTNSLADYLQALKTNLFSPPTPRKLMKEDQQELYYSHNKMLRQDTIPSPTPSFMKKYDAESVVRTAMKEPDLFKRINYLQDMLYNVDRASQAYVITVIKKYKSKLNDQF